MFTMDEVKVTEAAFKMGYDAAKHDGDLVIEQLKFENSILKEKLNKAQADLKWYVTQMEMRGVSLARIIQEELVDVLTEVKK